jgi:glycosyltransferase involved in cell wall biosynthesis
MRIAIDYTSAIAQGAGIGRYTRSLVAALARVDEANRYLLFSSEAPTPERSFPESAQMRSRVISLAGRPIGNRAMTILWHRLHVPLPVELVTGKVDVLHAPDFSMPPALRTPRVVTIHDLAFLTHPECALPDLVEYLKKVVPRAVGAAKQLIADSQNTAEDLVKYLGVERERINVIYLGVDPRFRRVDDQATLRALDTRLGLKHPLVLSVGTLEPRKNYERLIAAFAQARQQPDGPRMLAICGRKGWLYQGTFAAVEKWGVQDSVRILENVGDADLPALYSTADVVAMPSLYEGFGIPVTEAMACGTPVVSSTGGSLPEVAGDAALTVAPEDVDGLAAALLRGVSDADLRQQLVARGYEWVQRFNWDNSARAHVQVYERVDKGAH